jgi:hypothetical protein
MLSKKPLMSKSSTQSWRQHRCAHTQGIVCRACRPVAIRVRMEHRLQQRFKPPLDHHLCNSVRHRGDAQRPSLAITLRYVNAFDRRREVAARSHAIPDPVQVLAQIPLEFRDRDSVNTGRTAVGLDALVRLPHFAPGRFQTTLLQPRASSPRRLCTQRSRTTTPLRSSPITGPSALLRASPSLCPASVLWPSRRLSAWASPLASGRQVPTFLTEA